MYVHRDFNLCILHISTNNLLLWHRRMMQAAVVTYSDTYCILYLHVSM